MALFKRRKSQTISDIENYYAQHESSNTRAWAMAFFSLLITISVLSLLFLGGRWVYRTVTKDDTKVTVATKDSDADKMAEGHTDTDASGEHSNHETDSQHQTNGTVSEEAAKTTTPSNTSNSSNDTTHSSTTQVPKTGAGDMIFVIPAVTFVGAYLYSRRKQLR